MKRIVSAFLALAVSATLVFLATSKLKHDQSVVHAQGGCSDATLTGNYPFVLSGASTPGHSVTGKNNVPTAAVGVLTFDGAGGLALTYTVVFNGKATTASDTGTYTVNSDCTGTFTDTTINVHFNLVTVGGGTEVFGIETDPGFTDTFDAKKQ